MVVVIRGWKCEDTINRAIRSVLDQDARAHIVLDPPTDFASFGRVTVQRNDERMGVAHNMYHGILGCGAKDEEIVGILDADDYLLPNAINFVEQMYQTGCLLTYGSYIKASKNRVSRLCKPYPSWANPRKYKWRASHFKTFKYKLFKHLKPEDFQHNGKWLSAASDLALMIPLMEIAGMDNCRFVPIPIYWYNDTNPNRCDRADQIKCEYIVRHKEQYKRLY